MTWIVARSEPLGERDPEVAAMTGSGAADLPQYRCRTCGLSRQQAS